MSITAEQRATMLQAIECAECDGAVDVGKAARAVLDELDQAKSERDRWVALLASLGRGMVLSDHLGDAWGAFIRTWKLAGLGDDIPRDDDDDPSAEGFEALGGRTLWGPESVAPMGDT